MSSTSVLQLIDSLKFGGAEVLLRDLARGLRDSGYQVHVGYSTPGPLVDELAAHALPLTRLRRVVRVDPLLLGQMVRLIRRVRPQIVHTHLFKSDLHGRLAARLCGVPVIVSTLHNSSAWAQNALLGRLYSPSTALASRFIAVSEEVRTYAADHLHIPPNKIMTIVNGTPVERFVGQDAAGRAVRSEFGIAPDAPLAGVIARLSPQKDHQNFLTAAAQIIEQMPNARFLVVGDGTLRSELEAQTAVLGLDDAVIFTGLRNDIPAVLAALDVLVFSSQWEGLPVALLEGMASARPVVATAVGGVPGVVLDGTTGLLVPSRDPAALAAACLQLFRDPALRAAMGQASRTRVEDRYSMDAMVRQTVQFYETLLRERGLGVQQHGVRQQGEA